MTRVLCVDDEALIRMMVADCVEDLGLRAIEAESGEQALARLDEAEVSLLITDIRMGGMSGWEVARRARDRQPDLPIIYISGYPSKGEALADSVYLSKPFRPHELQAAVRKTLGARTGTVGFERSRETSMTLSTASRLRSKPTG